MLRSLLVYLVSILRLPILWAAVFGTLGLNFLFNGVDHLMSPTASPGKPQIAQSARAQIEAGADPSALLPAPGTGGSIQYRPNCYRGMMHIARLDSSGAESVPYVSAYFDNTLYGQMMTIPPRYFVQYSHQEVTLTQISQLPPDASFELQRAMRKLGNCKREAQVIEAMLSSEYLRERDGV